MATSRRFVLYFAWDRPAEASADPTVLEDRFPALYEVRRRMWPALEDMRDPKKFPEQGIAGTLDYLVLPGFDQCRQVIRDETGQDVHRLERVTDKGEAYLLGEARLGTPDTLVILSFDHQRTRQAPTKAEVEWVQAFVTQPEHCLVICPHHNVGDVDRLPAQHAEFAHHGDPLVPAQQRLGGFARALLKALGYPIENRYGLRPARTSDSADSALVPLTIRRDLDRHGVLTGVTTFNGHLHLPHLFVPPEIENRVAVLAEQPVDMSAGQTLRGDHPFFQNGQRTFNAMLELTGPELAAPVFVCDATLWSSRFGGVGSLTALWTNLARLRTRSSATSPGSFMAPV